MEIEQNNSIILISIMNSVLSLGLLIYIMNIIDNWNNCELIIDTILIIFAIGADIYEISVRLKDKGYNNGANNILLNFARVIRGLMLQRRASNFIQEIRIIYQSKRMTKKLRRKNSVTDMLNDILVFLGKDENILPQDSVKFLKKGINHAKDLVMETRHRNDMLKNRSEDENGQFGYNHHERMDEADELDR